MKQILIIIFFICSYEISIAQNDSTDWIGDIEFLKRELSEKHYNLFFQQPQADFNLAINNLISKTSYLTDFQILDNLSQIVAKVGDTHTHIDFGKFNRADKILPFSLYWFSDGLFITHASVGFEDLLGHKLIAINGYSIEQIVDSLSTLIAIDNKATIKNTIPRMIGFVPHLEYFGFSLNDSIHLTLVDVNGVQSIFTISKKELNMAKVVRFEPDSMSFCWKNRNLFFTSNFFEQDSILYVQYNRCWSKELELIFGSRPSLNFKTTFLSKLKKGILKKLCLI